MQSYGYPNPSIDLRRLGGELSETRKWFRDLQQEIFDGEEIDNTVWATLPEEIKGMLWCSYYGNSLEDTQSEDEEEHEGLHEERE